MTALPLEGEKAFGQFRNLLAWRVAGALPTGEAAPLEGQPEVVDECGFVPIVEAKICGGIG